MEILASLTVCIGLIGSVGLATLQGFPVLLAGINIGQSSALLRTIFEQEEITV